MLKCRTGSMTKPATQITWSRNTFAVSERLEEKVQEDEERHVYSSESWLHLTVQLDEQGSEYKCKAIHVGLLPDQEVSATVSLSVLLPPSKPQLSGFEEGRDVVRAGDQVTLSCTARGGNPLASVVWFAGDSLLVDESSVVTVADGVAVVVNNYTFVVKPDDNRRVFRCEAANSIASLSSELRLDVHFPAVNIKINGPSVGKINDVLRYQCIIGPSNPAPKHVTWIINGLAQSDGVYPVEHWQEQVSFGFMARTNISVLLSETMRTVACSASSSVLNSDGNGYSDSTSDGDTGNRHASIDVHVLRKLRRHPRSLRLSIRRPSSQPDLRCSHVSNARCLISRLPLFRRLQCPQASQPSAATRKDRSCGKETW